jgi:hypothetical protein
MKGRIRMILLINAVFAFVNIAAYVTEIQAIVGGVAVADGRFGAEAGFWVPLSFAVTWIANFALFFLCASGFSDQLLYKDTSYLMLLLPRRGWQVIAGRHLAGFVECLAYAIPGFVYLTVHLSLFSLVSGNPAIGFLSVFAEIWKFIFVTNGLSTLTLLLILVCVFFVSGSLLSFAAISTRSFIRSKALATVVSIAIFVFVTNWTVKVGTAASERLQWFGRISFQFTGSGLPNFSSFAGTPAGKELLIPIVPILVFTVLGVALFAASSWLWERKVEL